MELVNKIDNKEIYANRSVNDSEGNVIKDTYTKKSDFATWTDEEGHTYVTGLDGKDFNAHWANYAGKDGNGNDLTGKMDSSKLGYDKDGKISSYNGVEFAGGSSTGVNVEIVDSNTSDFQNGILYFVRAAEYVPPTPTQTTYRMTIEESRADRGEFFEFYDDWGNEIKDYQTEVDEFGTLTYILNSMPSDISNCSCQQGYDHYDCYIEGTDGSSNSGVIEYSSDYDEWHLWWY